MATSVLPLESDSVASESIPSEGQEVVPGASVVVVQLLTADS